MIDGTDKIRSFDDYLLTRVGVGQSQYWSTLALSMICLADGAEIFVMGFLLPVIKVQWDLTDSQLSFLAMVLFLGQFIGNLLTGRIADQIGRRNPLLFGSIGICLGSLGAAFSQSLAVLNISRLLFGFAMGIVVPVIACYVTEIYPQGVRAKYYLYMGQAFPLGELITILIAWAYLDSLSTGDWRKLLLFAAFPSVICVVLVIMKVKQSPRFQLMVKQDYKRAFEILDEMGLENKGPDYIPITQDEKNQLIIQKNEIQREIPRTFWDGYKLLFQDKYLRITILQTFIWFSLTFIFYGVGFMLPTIIIKMRKANGQDTNEGHDTDMLGILFAVLIEFPSNQIAAIFVEKENIGRKKLIFYSYLFCGGCCILAYWQETPNLLFYGLITCVKFSINICFVVVYPFASEIYPTQVRTTSLGYLNAICRIGGILMPYISFLFFFFGNTGPLLASGFFAFLSAAACYMIPQDTTNIQLDTYDLYQEMVDIFARHTD